MRAFPSCVALGCRSCSTSPTACSFRGRARHPCGQREPRALAPAAVAAGVDGLFLETHPDPWKAKSGAQNALALDRLDALLGLLTRIDAARRDAS